MCPPSGRAAPTSWALSSTTRPKSFRPPRPACPRRRSSPAPSRRQHRPAPSSPGRSSVNSVVGPTPSPAAASDTWGPLSQPAPPSSRTQSGSRTRCTAAVGPCPPLFGVTRWPLVAAWTSSASPRTPSGPRACYTAAVGPCPPRGGCAARLLTPLRPRPCLQPAPRAPRNAHVAAIARPCRQSPTPTPGYASWASLLGLRRLALTKVGPVFLAHQAPPSSLRWSRICKPGLPRPTTSSPRRFPSSATSASTTGRSSACAPLSTRAGGSPSRTA